MNGAVRPAIVNGPQQQNMLAINQNFMQQPSMPSMNLLNQQGPPGQPRYPAIPPQVQQQQQQLQQQRQLAMGRPQQQSHLPFNPANIMGQAQNPVRRVPSQPHMGLGLPGQMAMRPAGLQQATQQQQQQQRQLELARQQQAQQQQPLVRTLSTSQVMNSLNGPLAPQLQPSNSHPQMNPFQAAQQQHMSSQISASPRQPPGLGMASLPLNRARMNPDEPFPFPGSQFPGMPTNMPRQTMNNPANGMYPFGSSSSMSNPASSPPPGMPISDLAQGGSPGSIAHAAGATPNRNGFLSTSPQQFDVMSNASNDPMFNGMPPPTGIPPRPPSHGPTPMSQQQMQAQQAQQQQQQQQQQLHQHQMLAQGRMQGPTLSMSMAMDGMNSMMNPASLSAMGMGPLQPQRPQSQPQNVMGMNMGMPGRPPSQASNNAMSAMGNSTNNGSQGIPRPPSARGSPSQMQMTASNNNAASAANSMLNNNNNSSNSSNTASSLSPPGPSTSTLPTPSNPGSIGSAASGSSSVIPPNIPLTATGRIPNAPPGTAMPLPQNPASGSSAGRFPLGSMGMMPIAPRPSSSARGANGPGGPGSGNAGVNGAMGNGVGPASNTANGMPSNPGAPQSGMGGANSQGIGAQGPGPGPGPGGDPQRQLSQPPPHGQPAQANAGAGPRGPTGAMNGGPPNTMHPQNGSGSGLQAGILREPLGMSGPIPAGGGGLSTGMGPAGQVVSVPNVGVGHGQGLMRLLQFSGILAQHDSKKKLDYKWWQDVVQEYFHPASVLKFTLWRDSQRVEAKPFEIGVPILPRFFLVTTQSGVKSMSLSLDGARERFFGAGHSVIECVHAQWTYRYTNGYCVVLRGPLTVHVIITDAPRDPSAPPNPRGQPSQVLKFEDFQFDANAQEKFISVDNISGIRHNTPHYQREVHPWMPAEGHSPSLGPITPERQAELDRAEAQRWEEALVKVEEAEIPGEPVNAFGIPQATMRCLELAESVMSMADLITYSEDINARSEENPLSAMETLSKFAAKLRDSGAVTMPPKEAHPFYLPFQSAHESIEASVGQTLEPMASGYVIYPDGSRVLVKNPYEGYMLTRAGGTTAHSSPDKQQTTAEPQPPQTPSVAASPATTNNTPALASATLKRKNPGSGEATSPVVGNQETAGASGSKPRVPRKRNRTQGA